MGVPTSKVGYTFATVRREDHEVHENMWWHWGGKKIKKKMQFITENCVLLNSFITDDVTSSFTLEKCSSHFTHTQLQHIKT
jgi:hypothetical protein